MNKDWVLDIRKLLPIFKCIMTLRLFFFNFLTVNFFLKSWAVKWLAQGYLRAPSLSHSGSPPAADLSRSTAWCIIWLMYRFVWLRLLGLLWVLESISLCVKLWVANFECPLYTRLSIMISCGVLNPKFWEARIAVPVLQMQELRQRK